MEADTRKRIQRFACAHAAPGAKVEVEPGEPTLEEGTLHYIVRGYSGPIPFASRVRIDGGKTHAWVAAAPTVERGSWLRGALGAVREVAVVVRNCSACLCIFGMLYALWISMYL